MVLPPDEEDDVIIDATSPDRGPIVGIGCDGVAGTIDGPNPAFGHIQVMDINTSGTFTVEGRWRWRDGTGTAIININGSPTVIIDGSWRGTDNGVSIVNISGNPDITVNGNFRGGDESGSFYINMSGGTFYIDDEFTIGDNGGGELNMSGGTLIVNNNMDIGGLRGSAPITINMTGGFIQVREVFLFPGSASRAGNVWLNLDGGVIDCNEFWHGGSDGKPWTDDWKVDIEEGELRIGGDVRDKIDANVAAGQITAYDGFGTVKVDLIDGNTVVTAIPPDANYALYPNPENGATSVEPDVILQWQAGVDAVSHDVYFGTNFDDVNNATSSSHPNVDYANVAMPLTEFDPLGASDLAFNTTYYWRVDAVGTSQTWKGSVWQFTTRGPIFDPYLRVWYPFDEPNGFVAVDYSGRGYNGAVDGPEGLWDPTGGQFGGCRIFNDDDGDARTVVDVPPAVLETLNGKVSISVWLKDASYPDEDDNWVCAAGAGGETGPYQLQVAVVRGDSGNAYFRAGNDSNDVIEWNFDGVDPGTIEGWHHWVFIKDESQDKMEMWYDVRLVAAKTGVDNTLANVKNTPFKVGAAPFSDNYDFVGKMDDFRVYDKALTFKELASLFRGGDVALAWAPTPPDLAKDVVRDVNLVWRPGDYAVQHDVYFGTNFDDVNDADTSSNVYKGRYEATTYDPGPLELNTTYYWRIDEVSDPCIWKGNVWRFTVANYLVVDDFESYGSQAEFLSNWGYLNSPAHLITLGLPPYPAHTGTQSLYYTYLNYLVPYYAEAARTLDPAQDWTEAGVKILTLFFSGWPTNSTAETMFCRIEDSSSNLSARVNYGDQPGEDMSDVQLEEWQEWNIPLSSFSGVDLTSVSKLRIGFGPESPSSPGGMGQVFFDDIRLYPPRCVPAYGPPYDFSGNCVVDMADVAIMAEQWLRTDACLPVQAPSTGPVGWWTLDGSAVDSSGNGHNGTPQGNFSWVAGQIGGAIEFAGDGGKVLVPHSAQLSPTTEVTVTAWVYVTEPTDYSSRVVAKGADEGDNESYALQVEEP